MDYDYMANAYRRTQGLEPLEPFNEEVERVVLREGGILKKETFKGLKPCPFCGSQDIYISRCGDYVCQPSKPEYERLVCSSCGVGNSPRPKNEDQNKLLIREWNTRTS